MVNLKLEIIGINMIHKVEAGEDGSGKRAKQRDSGQVRQYYSVVVWEQDAQSNIVQDPNCVQRAHRIR